MKNSISSIEHNKRTVLSVIVPVHNEDQSVEVIMLELDEILHKSGYLYELIAVDDGSTDDSAQKIQRSPAHLISHNNNKGYGAAVKTGIINSSGDYIIITDADGTYPVKRIPDLFAGLIEGDHDMVVGARVGLNVNIPLVRRPAKWLIGKFAEMITGEPIPDINSGLRIFRRDAALQLFSLFPNGFSFTTTITLGMLNNGYSVRYIPIDYHRRVGKSKIRPISDTLNFITLIIKSTLYFAPLKFFLSFGAVLGIVALIWGMFSFIFLDQFADASTIMIFLTAVQISVIGFIAELINRRVPNIYVRQRLPSRDMPPDDEENN